MGEKAVQHCECDVKRRLLEAAKRLFAQEGFEAASVRQICVEAGANVALVSYHFGGKEQLFKAIFDHYFRPERYEIFEKLRNDPTASMKAFIEAIVNYRFDEPEMVAITMQEVTSATKRSEILKEYFLPVWSQLKNILEKGRSQGIFRIDSVDYAMTGIMGLLLFPPKATMIGTILESPLNRGDMIRHMTVYVFRLLGTDFPQEQESVHKGDAAE
jgi:AcrR family transcriptional regulator